MSRARRGPKGEHGVGVVLVLALVGALTFTAAVAVAATAVVVGHRRAQSAADLAALAAATALRDGGDPCAAAAEVAEGNGAEVEGCEVVGATVAVVARARLPDALGDRWVRARARAGPSAPDRRVGQRTLPRTWVISIRSATLAGFSRGTL